MPSDADSVVQAVALSAAPAASASTTDNVSFLYAIRSPLEIETDHLGQVAQVELAVGQDQRGVDLVAAAVDGQPLGVDDLARVGVGDHDHVSGPLPLRPMGQLHGFAAGRSSYLDGGIHVCRLNPITGQLLSETMIDSLDPETGELPEDALAGFVP